MPTTDGITAPVDSVSEPIDAREPTAPASVQIDLVAPVDVNRTPKATETYVDGTYTVQKRDSFWTISRHAYGTARYYRALAAFNRDRIPNPTRLQPGTLVSIPPPDVLEQQFPTLVYLPARTVDSSRGASQAGFFIANGEPAYRVRRGDMLSDIAQRHLGRASRWRQIYQMNRQIVRDPDDLKPGIVLLLPSDASQVVMTR